MRKKIKHKLSHNPNTKPIGIVSSIVENNEGIDILIELFEAQEFERLSLKQSLKESKKRDTKIGYVPYKITKQNNMKSKIKIPPVKKLRSRGVDSIIKSIKSSKNKITINPN